MSLGCGLDDTLGITDEFGFTEEFTEFTGSLGCGLDDTLGITDEFGFMEEFTEFTGLETYFFTGMPFTYNKTNFLVQGWLYTKSSTF